MYTHLELKFLPRNYLYSVPPNPASRLLIRPERRLHAYKTLSHHAARHSKTWFLSRFRMDPRHFATLEPMNG